jgi:signal transduction histidine kinase
LPKLPRHARELQALGAVARAAAAADSLPVLLNSVLAQLGQALPPVQQGLVLLLDPASGQLRTAAAFGVQRFESRLVPVEPALLQPVLAQGQPLLLTSRVKIERAASALPPATRAALLLAPGPVEMPRGLLALPLAVGSHALGVLWLLTLTRPAHFTPRDIPFVQQLAELLAVALARLLREAPGALAQSSQMADQMRSEVTATLSHELRTPLAAIKGYATALLLDEVEWSTADRKEFLELIERECDTLQTMISEMLDSALIDTGHLGLETEPVHLAHLVREAAEEAQRQTTRHRLVLDLPAGFPLVQADPRRIRQVLRNILDNALKYSAEGGLIVVRGEARPADVVISVADQGAGIAPENLIPLFEKYFRVKPAAGERVPGTGLGLPISRGIVEAHGGRIWAESRLGHGTTFYFSLPRLERGEAPAPPAVSEP